MIKSYRVKLEKRKENVFKQVLNNGKELAEYHEGHVIKSLNSVC